MWQVFLFTKGLKGALKLKKDSRLEYLGDSERWRVPFIFQRHIAIHEEETPFKCRLGECLRDSKGFRRKDNFLRHLMAVHNLSKDGAKNVADETGENPEMENRILTIQDLLAVKPRPRDGDLYKYAFRV